MLVGIETPGNRTGWTVEDSLEELGQLARTAGAVVVGTVSQKLASPSPSHYLGSGKLRELQDLRSELNYDLVLVDDELTPSQQRSLEEALNVKVLDRTALILDIFGQRAQTREGRLQVELAQHEYLLPRLAGQWSHLERLGGGIGTRGPGETQLETDRRMIRRKIQHLKREIEDVRRHRALHRRRRNRQGLPIVALVGYTNAGKSTLLNALTGANTLAEDKLFATLDPTTRRFRLPSGRAALITDTVGFIQKLPHSLIAAFRATLEELDEADLLLHVVDATHPMAAEQAEIVDRVLGELGLAERPRLLVLNKVDRLVPPERLATVSPRQLLAEMRELAGDRPDAVLISAARGWGLDDLGERIEARLGQDMVELRVLIPYGAEWLVHLFRTAGVVAVEEHREAGTYLAGHLPERLAARFRAYTADQTATWHQARVAS